ncbi:hypothetical protein [Polyangium mundeleinium]|uniref:Uncharacterized protein n=1 Tax=Polyangium mundeleinium TaxID=2995306 RepID=A0ABT5F1P5_9BACT|nr:hypothetical protein [Polyangium mundeleinium]MDC0748013.1 hypothetical protein [Polyangium mundeleinium]
MNQGVLRLALSLALIGSGALTASTARAAVPGECFEGPVLSGARTLYCIPAEGWNGEVVAYAHGYVPPMAPLDYYGLVMADGTPLPDLVQSLGYAFATTSYRRNGLAVLEGVEDIRNLIDAFPAAFDRAYVTGPSEGGLVTALLAEDELGTQRFDGALSLCGPIGSFRRQLNDWGDFRVLFDAIFPGVLPPSPISIPPTVIAQWETTYAPGIAALLPARPLATAQLISTSKAPIDIANPATAVNTTLGLLWYNVFATNDGIAQLGGNPFDNQSRFYHGSFNDLALNAKVKRFSASPIALANVTHYETSGAPTIPLVTMHTLGDEIIPSWHQSLYQIKLLSNGEFGTIQIPIPRYGHCNFTTAEVLVAFNLMVLQATGEALSQVPAAYDVASARSEIERAAAEFAARDVEP